MTAKSSASRALLVKLVGGHVPAVRRPRRYVPQRRLGAALVKRRSARREERGNGLLGASYRALARRIPPVISRRVFTGSTSVF